MTALNLCVIEGHLISDITVCTDYSHFCVKNGKNTITVKVKDKLASVCTRYLSIGSHVLITGYNEGTHVIAKEVKFLPV